MMTNPNDPAFANVVGHGDEHYLANGLTKLEYFAAMAMSGYLFKAEAHNRVEDIALVSIEIARALIAELNKEPLGGES